MTLKRFSACLCLRGPRKFVAGGRYDIRAVDSDIAPGLFFV